MPNGDPDFHTKELPILERFFAQVAPAITRFAERHSLRIQRYYHDLPSWQLCFEHPKGGCAYVEVRRERDDAFRLLSAWWVDGAGTRSSRFADAGPFAVRGTAIESLLQKHYTTVLRWRPGHWTLVSRLP